jgi:hypothetical protein
MNTVIDVEANPNAAPGSGSVQAGKELTILQ